MGRLSGGGTGGLLREGGIGRNQRRVVRDFKVKNR